MGYIRKIRELLYRIPFLRAIATQLYAVMGAWAIVSGGGGFRMFALGTAAAALLIPFVFSLEAGLLAVVAFEPFRGLMRRAQYLLVPYSDYEPIHLITPFVTFIALLSVLFKQKLAMFWSGPLGRPVFILVAICTLQIFNPIQGGLFTGFSGALFYLVPMAWFYFGQAASFELFGKLFRFVAVLGFVASLYGIYQIYFGYPDFELYWLNNTDKYSSIDIYNVKRALATFSNAEEWGRYVQIGCICAAGFGMMARSGIGRLAWYANSAALAGMLALTGQRSSIFGLFFGAAVLFLTGSKSVGNALVRIGVVCLPFVLIFTFVTALSSDEIYDMDESNRAGTILSHTARGTVNPGGEGSLAVRFERWSVIVTDVLPSNPIGNGLGAATMTASREGEKTESAIDNHFLSLAIGAGIPAAILLTWILIKSSFIAVSKWKAAEPGSENGIYYRIALALLSTFFLNNFFGTSFVIYSVAPLGWYVIGWIGRTDQQD